MRVYASAEMTLTDTNDGISVTGIDRYYMASSSSSGITVDSQGWLPDPQETNPISRYHWSYEVVNYSSGPPVPTKPAVIGVYGKEGKEGVDAVTVSLSSEAHTFAGTESKAIASSITIDISAFKGNQRIPTSIGTVTGGISGKLTHSELGRATTNNKLVINVTSSLSQGNGTLSIPIVADGRTFNKVFSWSVAFKGNPGDNGTDGTTTYTWIKYAETPTSGMSNSPIDKKYIGLSFNQITQDESNNYNDYQWSLMPQNIELGGRNLAINSTNDGKGWSSTAYNIIPRVELSEDWVVGETYTVSIKGTISEPSKFGVWRDTASVRLGDLMSYNPLTGVHTQTFSNVRETTRAEKNVIAIYNVPFTSDTSSSIEWIKVEKGDTPTDWSPAPADLYKYSDEVAQAKAEAERITAQAYADGIVTVEETERIAQAEQVLKDAKAHALQSIENIDIGGRNLILDSNNILMNSADTGGNGGLAVRKDDYVSITPKNNGNVYAPHTVKTSLDRIQNETYTVSLEVNTLESTGMYWYVSNNYIFNDIIPNTNGKWVRGSHTYTQSGETKDGDIGFLWGFNKLTAGKEIKYRNLKLEKGNKATDWTPAPEDTQSQIDDTKEQVKKTIKTITEEYYQSTSATSQTGSDWTTVAPDWQEGKFIFIRSKITYVDGTTDYTPIINITGAKGDTGDTGNDGNPGKDGVGVQKTDIDYATSTSGTTKPSTGWGPTVPSTEPGDYIWTRTTWTYTDGDTEEGYSVSRIGKNGNTGSDGNPGKDGVGIKDTVINYAASSSGTTKPASGWDSTIPSVNPGNYLWTRTTWTYTDNDTEEGYSVSRIGENGTPTYTWIRYADTPTSGMSDSPIGKKYIGLSFNQTTQDETEVYSDYQWSLMPQNINIGGRNYLKSSDLSSATKILAEGGVYDFSINREGTTPLFANLKLEKGKYIFHMIMQKPAGDSVASIRFHKNNATISYYGRYPEVDGEWNRLEVPFEVTDETDFYGAQIYNHNFGDSFAATVKVMHLMIEKGDTATDWTPAPEDTQSQIDDTKEQVKKTIKTITEEYYQSTNSDTTVGGRWVTEAPKWDANKFMFVRSKITYVDGTSDYTPEINLSGAKGDDGKSQWVHIGYSPNPTGSGMTTNPYSTTKYIGIAVTNSATAPAYTGFNWSKYVGEKGDPGEPGQPGDKGDDGQTTYTWIRYADTPTSGMENFPDGKKYIGLAFNQTTQDESNNYNDYQWSLMPQNINIGGRNYFSYAYHSNRDNYTYSGAYSHSKEPIQLEPNTEYILSYEDFVRFDSGQYVLFMIDSSDRRVLQIFNVIGSGGAASPIANRGNDYLFTTNGDGLYRFSYYANGKSYDNAPDGEWFTDTFSGFQIEKGNTTTDWTPAPEDLYKYSDEVAQAKAEAERIKAEAYADGKISDEERVRIAQAEQVLKDAKAHALESIEGIDIGGRNLAVYSTIGEYSGGNNRNTLGNKVTIEEAKINVKSQLSDLIAFSIDDVSQYSKLNISFFSDLTDPTMYCKFNNNTSQVITKFTKTNNLFTGTLAVPDGAVSVVIGLGEYPRPAIFKPYYIDKVMIEKGNKATDWTPAPEDTQSQIDETKEQVKKTIKSITEEYYQSTNPDTTVGDDWTTEAPSWDANKFMFVRSKITYVDGTTDYTPEINLSGAKGDNGDDGTTTYTWIRYADTPTTGMSEHPIDKKYIGLAFNQITQNESNDFNDYKWSLMPQNIEIGGRNLLRNSRFNEGDKHWSINGNASLKETSMGNAMLLANNSSQGGFYTQPQNLEVGRIYTISFLAKSNSTTLNSEVYFGFLNQLTGRSTTLTIDTSWKRYEYTTTKTLGSGTNLFHFYNSGNTGAHGAYITDIKIEKGNTVTDWTPAPEDAQAQIDEKASAEDLTNAKNDISNDINTATKDKLDRSEYEEFLENYQGYQEQLGTDLSTANTSLDTALDRTATVEQTLGEGAADWIFTQTRIRMSDEGITIGEIGRGSYIQVSNDKISFYNGTGDAVAYVSGGMLFINHAIFVESIQISEFMVSGEISGHLTFRYVGE